jgi:hypothetical protein
MSLITPMKQEMKVNRLTDTFGDTFGKGAKRSKPTLSVFNLSEYASKADNKLDNYNQDKDIDFKNVVEVKEKGGCGEKYMHAGQSKRIYRELHKVLYFIIKGY